MNHIRRKNILIRSKVVRVYYQGIGWDAAIKAELLRLGLRRGEVKIIALPENWKKDESKAIDNQ